MANKIIKGVIAVIIIAAVLVGVYFVMPGQVKFKINQFYQENFDDNAAKYITEYKAMKIPGTDVTFDKAFENKAKNHSWYVEEVVEGIQYKVHLNGYKMDIVYLQEDGSNSQHFTNTHAEYTFDVVVQEDGSHKNTGWHFLVDGNEKPEYDKKASAQSLAQ